LSEAELEILEELWNLIQTERTCQGKPQEELNREIAEMVSQQSDASTPKNEIPMEDAGMN